MKKIFFLFVILLFFSGCASLASISSIFKNIPGLNIQPSVGGKSFVGGTDSIKINILQPPEKGKISKEVPLRVSVNLKNNGEAKADGQVCVTGLSQEVFGGSNPCECQEFSLKGKARYQDEITEGDQSTYNFDEGQPTIGEFTLNDFSVTAIARFDYKTYAAVEGCIKKNILTSSDCKPKQDARLIGVSSAPMQITSVVQELLSTSENEYTMTLFIEAAHRGTGNFFGTSLNKNACNEEDSNINKRVEVKLVNAPGRFTCTPFVFKNKEDKATTTCTITGVQARDYKPLINIELSYVYELRESSNFEVV